MYRDSLYLPPYRIGFTNVLIEFAHIYDALYVRLSLGFLPNVATFCRKSDFSAS